MGRAFKRPYWLGSPWLAVALIAVALVLAYVIFLKTGTEFQLFLVWVLVVCTVALAFGIRYDATRKAVWLVLALGLMVKLVGTVARYEVYDRVYERSADAGTYFAKGLTMAQGLWRLDPTAFLQPEGPTAGTRYLAQVTGAVVTVSGPSLRAAFLLFSLLAFIGVLLIARSYTRVPGSDWVVYLAWLVFWPSLFFWPSSVGKEAFLMFALGLAVWGFARFPRPAAWVALPLGLLFAGLIRPHVAAVAGLAMLLGAVIGRASKGLSGRWYFQVLFFAAAFAVTFYLSAGALGIESAEQAVQLVQTQAEQSNVGGSAVGVVAVSPLHIPEALLRALFRPFIWEASSPIVLLSALEILVLIVLLVWRRRQLWASLKQWRTDRLLAFSVIFIVLYALMLGFAMSNLAIIARQRVLMLPMLLLLLQDRSSAARPPSPAGGRRRR